MAIQVIRNALVADAGVTALVGLRVAPLLSAQDTTLPAITLQRISLVPQNHLTGDGDLDAARVQLDAWATTYAEARAVADACRTCLQAANHQLELESDDYDPDTQEYRVIQDWSVWQ